MPLFSNGTAYYDYLTSENQEVLKMVDNYFVIDSHCHIYPDKIAVAATANTDRFYDIQSAHDGKVSTLYGLKEKAGIDHFIVQSVATTPKQVKSINEFIASAVESSDGAMTGLGTLHPDSADMKEDIRHLKELGLHGIKLHPDIQRFKIDDYRCLKIYELCEEEGLPILMHTGDNRYDYSNPNRLKPIMEIFSGLTVVGAHMGGWSIWEEACEKLKGIPNLYFDCSSTFHWTGAETAKRIITEYGCDRVLFGSDYPMWSPKKELEIFLSLGFTREENKMILSENARKVFGF